MKQRKYTPPHEYTEQQKQFIVEQAQGRSMKELLELFNSTYGTQLTYGQIKGAMARYGAHTGRDTRFVPGQKSWNEGRKGVRYSPATEFKKGHMPVNHKPVGTEVADSRDGYLKVKVAEPNVWKQKHRLVWEAANGPIPQGHALIFCDGNRLNCELDNLLMVTRGELAVINKLGLPIGANKEITHAAVQLAKLKIACNKDRLTTPRQPKEGG